MKLLPVLGYANQPSKNFKGYIEKDSSIGRFKLNELIKNNPNYEKTERAARNNGIVNIYMASPLENQLTPALKEKVDYIFYDIEPKFPDIDKEVSKMYFFPATAKQKKENFEQFESIKDYFNRLIENDSKTVGSYEQKAWSGIDMPESRYKADYFKAHVRDAKHNVETIKNCSKILEKTMPLIDKKDSVYEELQKIEAHKKLREKDQQLIGLEIDNRNQLDYLLKQKLKNLEAKKAAYETINISIKNAENISKDGKALTEKGYAYGSTRIKNTSPVEYFRSPNIEQIYVNVSGALKADAEDDTNEHKNVENKIKQLNKRIAEYSCEIEKNNIYIKKLTEYKDCLPEMIKILSDKTKKLTTQFEKLKADLIPHFHDLKNYFNSRGGIRVIR